MHRAERPYPHAANHGPNGFSTKLDRYESIEEVQEGLRRSGLEASQLILGIDFTKSNEWSGSATFNGHSLHYQDDLVPNPYEQAMTIVAKTLSVFDDDALIPCYGFGDYSTSDKSVFSFLPEDTPVNGIETVVSRYKEITPFVRLSGPTSFAPLINQALNLVVQSGMQYHILVIIADGQVTNFSEEETIAAIVKASKFPLSIIMLGVGDGPWDKMVEFDDELPARRFGNFQFVDFTKVMQDASAYGFNLRQVEAHFALHALMEIPQQYLAIQKLGLMRNKRGNCTAGSTDFCYAIDPPETFGDTLNAGGFSPSAPSL